MPYAMDFPEAVRYEVLGNELWLWGVAVATGLLTVFALLGMRSLLQHRLAKSSAATKTKMDDAVVHVLGCTRKWFALAVGAWAAAMILHIDAPWPSRISIAIVVLTLIQGGIWLTAGLRWYLDIRYGEGSDPAERTGVTLLRFMGLVLVWSAVLLLGLTAAGVNVTALVAGLGVGGIAVALALQNILGDLFASVSIVMDKPFVVGEFIIVGSEMGTVQSIGLKTTRMKSLGGEEISFSNADLLSSRIRNYTRMQERRVVFSVGVTYDTPARKLAAIPGMLRTILEADDRIRFDRAHFATFGDFALQFEIVYNVLSPDFNVHMDIRQGFNQAIFERFEAEGIEFAFPTQTLHIPDVRALGNVARPRAGERSTTMASNAS